MTSTLLLYQPEDGRTRIDCRFEGETLWLTQAQMAELIPDLIPNINLHLTAIEEVRRSEEVIVKSHLIIRSEGSRLVTGSMYHRQGMEI